MSKRDYAALAVIGMILSATSFYMGLSVNWLRAKRIAIPSETLDDTRGLNIRQYVRCRVSPCVMFEKVHQGNTVIAQEVDGQLMMLEVEPVPKQTKEKQR